MADFEKYYTITESHEWITMKLSVAMFINTGVIPLFVNLGTDNWFKNGGLVVDVTYNMFIICFLTPIASLIDFTYLWKLIKRWWEKRKGEHSFLTQRQANKLFEPPEIDLPQQYANTILLFCMTFFYMLPCPIMPVLAFMGSFIQYWVEKWLLLRRCKTPSSIGESISILFITKLPYMMLLYAISMVLYESSLSGIPIFGFIALFIILVSTTIRALFNSLVE
jgi:hypothetical protein